MALIRCKNCGNPVSSRSKACPICGIAIAAEMPAPEVAAPAAEPAIEPVAPAAEATPAPTQQPTPQPATTAKTLNDIIAERKQAMSLNDRLTTEVEVAPAPAPTKVVAEAEPTKVAEEHSYDNYDGYDGYERTVEDYEQDIMRHKRSARGFMIGCVVLLLAIIPLAIFTAKNYGKVETIEKDYALLESARTLFEEENSMLESQTEDLVAELEQYKHDSDSMMVRYREAVVMLEQLQKEKTYNYEQLSRYKREVETLKGIMKQYVHQIDSLNKINNSLQKENVAYKSQIADAKLRANVAEEKADELGTKVRIGAVIQTSAIKMAALNDKSKEVRRIRQAKRLRVDFELTANALAEPGEKSIYLCITGPDGYMLSPTGGVIVFMYEGSEMMASAMRKVDYENQSVPVSIFYDGDSFAKGTYKVDVYIDGRHCGSQETYFE